MILTMLVTLYTSRVVLQVLGVEDFGIYNVVGGVVVMFSFLNSAMSSATQRFLSFELGKNDMFQFNRVFSMSINIHALIALIIFVLAETIGLWFVNTQLVIPESRLVAANWVYQCSILAFMVSVMSVPYNAAIIANERMGVFAYISIIEVSLKLLIVFMLQWILFDKLILYAILILVVAVIIRIIYGVYCKLQIEGCKYRWIADKKLFSTLFSYAGWNLWGNMAAVGMDQGVNILLNVFFGPVVNAARGIAYQLSAAVRAFVGNFQMAVNPQIVKRYANNELASMHSLIFMSAKVSFLLLLFMGLPLAIEAEYVLSLWLGQVPEYTVVFVRLVILIMLIDSLSGPLMTAAQASGRIKKYQTIVGGLLLLIPPISYLLLLKFSNPIIPFIVNTGMILIALFARLVLLRKLVGLSIRRFFQNVIIPITIITTLASLSWYIPNPYSGFGKVIFTGCITSVIIILLSWFIALSSSERMLIKSKIIK